jgi:hypothetical protein
MKLQLTPEGAKKLIGNKFNEWALIYSHLDFSEAKLLAEGKNPNTKFFDMIKRKEVECREAALDNGYRVKVVYEVLSVGAISADWIIEQKEIDLKELTAKIGGNNFSE